ncbi:MAG: hypothetical protein RIR44_725, partial [Bacteroidota bacterium]
YSQIKKIALNKKMSRQQTFQFLINAINSQKKDVYSKEP